ncbi:MAG: peptidylprolyl isomerase [Acidimicrobiales bacterium]|nr:peptidylprolyl isomerase [Acidimicrobiales bacterium]
MKLNRIALTILTAILVQGVFAAAANVQAAQEIPVGDAQAVEVIFETTMGSFTVELYPGKAPITVANFLAYVDQGFYDNTIFHRVISRFVVQGGGFETGMKPKQTLASIENESNNGLKNTPASISMARKSDPGSATSQFFINLKHNVSLDAVGDRAGYTVFGKITKGFDVMRDVGKVTTIKTDRFKDVPEVEIVVLSATRQGGDAMAPQNFIEGQHYVVLDKPIVTRDSSKVEVVEAFAYGCPYCLNIEPALAEWKDQQVSDVDFWKFPAVWNDPMKLFARAFYVAQQLDVVEKIHLPLFTAVVVVQKKLNSEMDLAIFFEKYGVDKAAFSKAFKSTAITSQVKQSETLVKSYNLASVPQIVVNGKYRIDPMRAGGRAEMLAVVNFLVEKERASLKK